MRERIVQQTLTQHQNEINQLKAQINQLAQKAFEIDEISSSHRAYINACFEDMKNGTENSQNAQKAHLAYQNALKKYGYCENDFEYTPSCPLCNDTGNHDGKVCKCLFEKFVKNLQIACDIQNKAKFSFDDCNLDLIKDSTQKDTLEKVYATMRKYANCYPNVQRHTVILSGGVGTGKTCLASAMSNEIVNKGYAVKILSAYEFCSLMLKVHTSPVADRAILLDDVLKADVLVIDDLGTEPMLKNVTVEYLLLVLEERQNNGRTTIITTNLVGENLLKRYGERVYSRLHHKQHSLEIMLVGKDLRLAK